MPGLLGMNEVHRTSRNPPCWQSQDGPHTRPGSQQRPAGVPSAEEGSFVVACCRAGNEYARVRSDRDRGCRTGAYLRGCQGRASMGRGAIYLADIPTL